MCCLGPRPKKVDPHHRCSATTLDGSRCKRRTASGFEECWQHRDRYYTPPPPPPTTECPICMDVALEPMVLPCRHAFHRECIAKWANRANPAGGGPTCPCCRAPFEKVDLDLEWRPIGVVRIPMRGRRIRTRRAGGTVAGGAP